MTMYSELLQEAIKAARTAYINAKTKEDRYHWQQLIKQCLDELNATHGRLIC